MNCPKCDFAVPTGEVSCPRCGVVFGKLGRERPPRPAPARPDAAPPRPRSSSEGASLFNVLVLAAFLSVGSVYAWQWWQKQNPPPEPAAVREPVAADVSEAPAPRVELPTRQPEPLILRGLGDVQGGAAAVPEPDPSEDIPELPDLNANSVNPQLLEYAKEVARDHPGVDWLREYVVAAHFLLSGREIQSRRYRAALRYLDGSEEWAAPPGDVATFRAVIFAAQEDWEVARTWAETALAYQSRSNPAEMHHIIGKAHYYREEMDKAIAAFRKALEIRNDPTIRASLDKAMREARTADGFRRQRLSHFIVTYDSASMEDTGRMVIDTMDRSYATLASLLGFEPSEPVVVILYSRRDYREMGGPHWSAGLFDGKIKVPVRGLERLDERLKATLHHELAHAFIHARAGKAAPRWLHEGLAEYAEGTRTEPNGKLLARVINGGQSFEHCLPTARCDVRVFYPAAASMVDYMIQKRGMGGVRDLLTLLGEGENIDASLRRVLGQDVSGLIRDWEHFIRRRYS